MPNDRTNIIKYKHNYLSNVIVQIDFSPIKRFFEEIPSNVIENLQSDYIFHQGQPIIDVQVNMTTGARLETAIPVWLFKSSDNSVEIQLTQNFLKFNCTKYNTFEDLIIHIKRVISTFSDELQMINRLGLRYINQIDLDETNPTDWTQYIDDSLICSIENWCLDSKNKISRAMSQIIINEDDYYLNFNYGIFNPIFPNTVMQKQYILDYDCYGNNIEINELISSLELYNNVITKSFEKSIKNSLRNKMVQIYE